MRILAALKFGTPVATIARQEGVTLRRMRMIVNALLAENASLEPASGFAQAEIRRLGAALEAALRTLGHGEAAAVDRVLRVVRELERYEDIGTESATDSGSRGARKRAKPETLGASSD